MEQTGNDAPGLFLCKFTFKCIYPYSIMLSGKFAIITVISKVHQQRSTSIPKCIFYVITHIIQISIFKGM